MKNFVAVFAIIAAVGFTSCEQLNQQLATGGPTPAPQIAAADSSQVVVYAEKTLRISKDTFDAFLKLEYQNQAYVTANLPQAHTFAEYVRRNAPTWLSVANNTKNLYKHNRSAVNKEKLMESLDVLTANLNRAQTSINQIQQKAR